MLGSGWNADHPVDRGGEREEETRGMNFGLEPSKTVDQGILVRGDPGDSGAEINRQESGQEPAENPDRRSESAEERMSGSESGGPPPC